MVFFRCSVTKHLMIPRKERRGKGVKYPQMAQTAEKSLSHQTHFGDIAAARKNHPRQNGKIAHQPG